MSTKLAERLDALTKLGYIELTNIFSSDLIDRVNRIVEKPLNTPTINGRKGYVQSGNTRFLWMTLSWGREIIELYSHPDIIGLADAYAADPVHLSNYRIYRTFPSQTTRMPWHVDNKIDVYDFEKDQFVTKMAPADKGLIFIVYLSDVEDGGFQIVEGSHTWTPEAERESWDDDEPKWADKIVTFNNRKRGTAIAYDYRCIHRAKPYTGGKIRTSLFAQYSPSRMPVGEPILLNTRDLAGLSDVQKRVLNFGQPPTTENWPIGKPSEILGALNGHNGRSSGWKRFKAKLFR